MKILSTLALCCLLFTAGCQNQPPAAKTEAEPAPAPPAAAEAAPAPAEAAPAEPTNTETAAAPDTAPAAGDEDVALKSKLEHRRFVIKTVDGEEFKIKLPEGAEEDSGMPQPFISFGQWPQVNGKICNTFRGPVKAKGDTLTMENAAITMMLCGDTGLSELESMFFKMMHEGVNAAFGEDNSLTLTGNGHTLVFTISDYVN